MGFYNFVEVGAELGIERIFSGVFWLNSRAQCSRAAIRHCGAHFGLRFFLHFLVTGTEAPGLGHCGGDSGRYIWEQLGCTLSAGAVASGCLWPRFSPIFLVFRSRFVWNWSISIRILLKHEIHLKPIRESKVSDPNKSLGKTYRTKQPNKCVKGALITTPFLIRYVPELMRNCTSKIPKKENPETFSYILT